MDYLGDRVTLVSCVVFVGGLNLFMLEADDWMWAAALAAAWFSFVFIKSAEDAKRSAERLCDKLDKLREAIKRLEEGLPSA